MEQPSPPPIPFIRHLCRDLTQEQIEEAEQSLREYLEIVVRIYDTMRANAALNEGDSTKVNQDTTIQSGDDAVAQT